jgi:hypothetical protein
MSLTGITAQTIFIDEKEKQFFEYVYDIVLKDKYYYFISESFEEYYFIMIDTIEYYEKLEQYEKCAILKKNIDSYIKKIPKNIDEAIEYLVSITPENKIDDFEKFDEFSFAIELHPTVGKKIIDIWLLRNEKSSVRNFFLKEYKMKNPDEIANTILKNYISFVKAKNSKL